MQWITRAVLVLAVGIPATFQPTSALCPTNQPLPASVAENEQFFAVLCGLGWQGGAAPLPCPKPTNPPTIDSTFSQSVVLSATVPDFMQTAVAAWWRVVYVTGYSAEVLYEYRSALSPAVPGGAAVTFRAPGLRTSGNHRYQVAFEDSNHEMTCWSPVKIGDTSPFAGGEPPPTDTSLMLEDEFTGPQTTFLANGGDGIGPDKVYRTQHQVQIDGDGHSVRLSDPNNAPPSIGAFAIHATKEGDPHAFSDALFVNDVATSHEYRVDAIARALPFGSGYKYYFAQVYKEGTLPATLRIGFRDLTDTANPLGITFKWVACSPPLDNENLETPGRSYPVSVRLEVGIDSVTGHPKLTGTVTWPGGEPCSVSELDPNRRLPTPGYVGFIGHHKEYLVERFLAGWHQ